MLVSRFRNFLFSISLSERETEQHDGFSRLRRMLSLIASFMTYKTKQSHVEWRPNANFCEGVWIRVWRSRTDLNVVERVELHEVMKPLEGLVGVFEVESREGRGWIVKYVEVAKLYIIVWISRNSFKKTEKRTIKSDLFHKKRSSLFLYSINKQTAQFANKSLWFLLMNKWTELFNQNELNNGATESES